MYVHSVELQQFHILVPKHQKASATLIGHDSLKFHMFMLDDFFALFIYMTYFLGERILTSSIGATRYKVKREDYCRVISDFSVGNLT